MEKNSSQSEIQNILQNPDFQKKLARISVQKEISQVQINVEAEQYLHELFTIQDSTTNIAFIEAFQYMMCPGTSLAVQRSSADFSTNQDKLIICERQIICERHFLKVLPDHNL